MDRLGDEQRICYNLFMKDNVKKTSRLSYIIIMIIFSLFIFIIPNTDDSIIGGYTETLLREKMKSYGFQACPIEKKKTNIGVLPYLYVEKCSPMYTKEIKISGLKLNADKMRKTKGYDPRINQMFTTFNEFNEENKFKFKYRMVTYRGYYEKAKKYTLFIMWASFLISLPLIWLSRNFSISIVNGTMKMFNKGWKKL